MPNEKNKINPSASSGQVPRPPIVVVMGHVDHGKTTLLDYIRIKCAKAAPIHRDEPRPVAGREAGGITQSIGAYEIIHNPSADSGQAKKITFIDTPGHEAFSKMRARGAHVADMAILIVAADDGVQPQTKESIKILEETKTPFIVAINKIDKPNADIERVKNDLMQNGVFLEGAGGNISWQKISAKHGEGINELLDLILLASEIENFTYNPDINASGIIIEAKLDSKRGITAIGIVKNGILKVGDGIATSSACGKIKILENFLGEKAEKLEPSAPFLILGFDGLPQIGEEFIGGNIKLLLKEKRIVVKPKAEIKPVSKNGVPSLNIILKADVSGSLEALAEIIKNLKQETVTIKIIDKSVGEITDGDIKLAASNNAIIIGFNAKANRAVENMAKVQEIKLITSKIIYELVNMIEKEMKDIEKPAPLGEVEILATFSQKDKKPAGSEARLPRRRQLVGGKVISGLIKNNISVKIIRAEEELGFGKITGLKSFKQEATQILAPNECGIMIESNIVINIGDKLVYMK